MELKDKLGLKGAVRNYFKELECPRCHKKYDASKLQNMCECGTPLLARYDLDAFKREFDIEIWERRPAGLWRYWELLPVKSPENVVTLGEGGTPVLKNAPGGRRVRD